MYKIIYNSEVDGTRSFSSSLQDLQSAVTSIRDKSVSSDSYSFTNSDLVDFVLTIDHGKYTANINPTWIDPNGNVKSLDSITIITDSQIIINFGGDIEAGTHKINYTYK